MNIKDIKEKIKKINFKQILNYTSEKHNDKLQKKALRALGIFFCIMVVCTALSKFTDSLTIPIVHTERITTRTIVDEFKAEGKIIKNREEKIKVVEGLKVEYINVSVGSNIKKGDTIAEVDVEDLKNKIDKLNKDIEKDTRMINRAEEDYNKSVKEKQENVDKALREMNEAKQAFESNNNPVNQQQLKSDYEMKKNQYDNALKELNNKSQQERALQDAKDSTNIGEYKKQLQKLQPYLEAQGKILSDKEGIVTSVFVENAGVTKDTIIAISDETDGYKFIAQIDENKRNLVKNGQEVQLQLSSGEKIEEPLIIQSIASNIENPKLVDITVILPVGIGKIDDMGEISILNESKEYEQCIPIGAIHESSNGYYVLVVDQKETVLGVENIAAELPVKILKQDNQFIALQEGKISKKQQIIVRSNKIIKDGDRIRLDVK